MAELDTEEYSVVAGDECSAEHDLSIGEAGLAAAGVDSINGIGSIGGLCSGGGSDSVGFCGVAEVNSEATSGWTRRVRIGRAPSERAPNHERKSALEVSLRSYADKKVGVVVDPAIGTSFDSLEEAYEFYNL